MTYQWFSSPFKHILNIPKPDRTRLQQGDGVLRFYYDGSVPFSCNLTCQRCGANTRGDVRCKKQTCKYQPYCFIHQKSVLGLVVKLSNIPNAGLGLFTTRDIPRNAIVCPYGGELTNRQSLHQRYGVEPGDFAPYGLDGTSTGRWSKDSACVRGVGSYANHALEARANVRFAPNNRTQTINLISKKAIPSGSEILVNYGRDYFRDNMAEFRTK